MRLVLLLAGAIVCALIPSASYAYPLCVSLTDVYALALADTQGSADDRWKTFVENGNCADIRGADYVLTIDSYVALDGDRTRIAQYALMGKPLYGLRLGDLPPPVWDVTYKPTGNEDQAIRDWFARAMLTPAAKLRLGWNGCCSNADRVVAVFESANDEWYYIKDGRRVLIPADTIHHEDDPTMPEQLKAEGVLFVVGNVVACFWPPQTGG